MHMTLTLVAFVGSLSLAAARDEAGGRPGLIVASNVYLFAGRTDSVAALVDAMSRLKQPQPISGCCEGAWRMHFAAWLERRPGETTLELRFDPATTPGGETKPTPLFSTTVPVDAASATVFVNDFVISRDQGFVAGNKYDVSLWRTSGLDRSAPLAKGSFILE
jgi:hypothetical protein